MKAAGIVRAVVAAMAFVSAGAAGAAEDEAIGAGRRIAEQACSPCHAIGRTGASPRAEAPAFRDLRHKYPADNLEEALAEGVVVGHPDMPEVKMTPREISDFVAWLKTIETR